LPINAEISAGLCKKMPYPFFRYCLILLFLILIHTGISHGQEVNINVPFSQTRLLEVDAGPDIRIQAPQEVSLGEQMDLVGGTPGFTYLWKDASGNNYTGQVIQVSSPGVYTLLVTDAMNCTASDSLELIDAVAAPSPGTGSLRLYPNPSGGVLCIPVIEPGEPHRIQVLSQGGAVLYDLIRVPSGRDMTLNLENLEPGFYLLRVTGRKSSGTYSLILK
jgi:hypothetical protein